jgi:hypothetical protein
MLRTLRLEWLPRLCCIGSFTRAVQVLKWIFQKLKLRCMTGGRSGSFFLVFLFYAFQALETSTDVLADQPRCQFIQMGFHFAQLLVYDQALKSRSAAVRESRITEMTRLSAAIMKLALDTADVRTRHLSDHIYHMITFAAVTLCRLLHMYENQLSSTHNIMELDSLVLTLVSWLHSIGLPCHVAHTLGDVVSAFHEKLRPNAHPSPYDQVQDDIGLYFPELLGMETFNGGNFDFVPDWEPYIPGPAT